MWVGMGIFAVIVVVTVIVALRDANRTIRHIQEAWDPERPENDEKV